MISPTPNDPDDLLMISIREVRQVQHNNLLVEICSPAARLNHLAKGRLFQMSVGKRA
jgi:hypothetical protein